MRLLSALLLAITIALPDGSAYSVALVHHAGPTWVYSVSRTAGKDLSHWVAGLGLCDAHVISSEPPATWGLDPTTGATGYKFEPIISQSATYTLTLDGEYPSTGTMTATMKAGALGNFASGVVAGPDCRERAAPVETVTPTPTATEVMVTPTATLVDAPATTTPTPTDAAPTVTPTVTPTATSATTNIGDGTEPRGRRLWVPWAAH